MLKICSHHSICLQAHIERYLSLPLNIIQDVVQCREELHVLVEAPSECLVNLETAPVRTGVAETTRYKKKVPLAIGHPLVVCQHRQADGMLGWACRLQH